MKKRASKGRRKADQSPNSNHPPNKRIENLVEQTVREFFDELYRLRMPKVMEGQDPDTPRHWLPPHYRTLNFSPLESTQLGASAGACAAVFPKDWDLHAMSDEES